MTKMTELLGEDRTKYTEITEQLYGAIKHFILEGRINLDGRNFDHIIPNHIDQHMMWLLGFKDVEDCVLNATQATRDTCERFRQPYTKMTWVLYKMLEARANENK